MFHFSLLIKLMVNLPLYRRIIMSIKFAKHFKHRHSEHCSIGDTPHYIVRPDPSSKLLRLSFKENKRDAHEPNSSGAIKDTEPFRQVRKSLNFYDFPTNISQFQEIQDAQLLNTPAFNSLLSLQNEDTIKGQQGNSG